MPEPNHSQELRREDVEAALTKLLWHGFGWLVVKVHGHRIAALETTLRQTRYGQSCETPAC